MPDPLRFGRQFSDEDLREALQSGMSQAQFAREHGVTKSCVSHRVTKLGLMTAAAATVAPAEAQRFTSTTINAIEELALCISRMKLLSDACHAHLQDADDPEKYDIGSRADEVTVTYWEAYTDGRGQPQRRRKKEKLSILLRQLEALPHLDSAERGDIRHADPRELAIRTVGEIRCCIDAGVELARLLADAKTMQALITALQDALAKASPEVAAEVAHAVRRTILLDAAFGGSGTLPAAGTGSGN